MKEKPGSAFVACSPEERLRVFQQWRPQQNAGVNVPGSVPVGPVPEREPVASNLVETVFDALPDPVIASDGATRACNAAFSSLASTLAPPVSTFLQTSVDLLADEVQRLIGRASRLRPNGLLLPLAGSVFAVKAAAIEHAGVTVTWLLFRCAWAPGLSEPVMRTLCLRAAGWSIQEIALITENKESTVQYWSKANKAHFLELRGLLMSSKQEPT